ncbi:MAG: peroxiredoxin [Bacteroidales bacterium]|nr:peroxiredoxin [Bacteroidales bacterium]MBN2632442.1 peroxiredoxin [Bacteroidales bacterium]
MKAIKAGDMIPDFSLPDQDGNMVSISDYLGKKQLVIFFYPQDGSLSCTREACYFRDLMDVFEEADAEVIGISGQSVESHKNFATANNLKYRLLADTNNEVRKLFGVPSTMFGLIPGRVTYVTDRNGKVVFVFNSQTEIQRHADEALKICLLLKKNTRSD